MNQERKACRVENWLSAPNDRGNKLGQTVVVENRGGAGGSIGSAFIANSAPDGYTLSIATVSTHGINPAIYSNLACDAERDFTPISNLASVPNVMSINPKVAAKTMDEFIKLAKASFTYASAGNGSVSHMMDKLFKMSADADLMHVCPTAVPQRVANLPDVPTFAEVGLAPVNDAAWFGLMGH